MSFVYTFQMRYKTLPWRLPGFACGILYPLIWRPQIKENSPSVIYLSPEHSPDLKDVIKNSIVRKKKWLWGQFSLINIQASNSVDILGF